MQFTCKLSIMKVTIQTILCMAIMSLCIKVGHTLILKVIEGDLYAVIGLLLILFFMLCFCIIPLYAIFVYCKKYKPLDIVKNGKEITIYRNNDMVVKSDIVMIENENTIRLFPVNYYRITLKNKQSIIIPSVVTNISKLIKGYNVNFNYGLRNIIPSEWKE